MHTQADILTGRGIHTYSHLHKGIRTYRNGQTARRTCIHTGGPTHIQVIHTYRQRGIHDAVHIPYIHTHRHHTYIRIYINTYIRADMHTIIHTYIQTYCQRHTNI